MAMRLTIRIAADALRFAVGAPKDPQCFVMETYKTNNGISVAANLREAFTSSELLQSGYQRTLVLTDTPVLLIPIDEYDAQQQETLYHHTFTGLKNAAVEAYVIPWAHAVAVFGVNKDLKTVLEDHFADIRFMPAGHPVWQHLFKNGAGSIRKRLYAYFQGAYMEVFCFHQNRFRFYNRFPAEHAHDALYYLLYTWKQLAYDADSDELYMVGDMVHKDWLMEKLHQYLRRAHAPNATVTFNRSQAAIPHDATYDLLALYL